MNHKEIERWYRLRNIKVAAQGLIVASIILVVVVYVASRFWPTEPEVPWPAPPDHKGIRTENFSYSSPGVHPWELRADVAEVSEGLDEVKLVRPTVVYKGGRGGEIVLNSQSGKLDRKTQTFSAQGQVTIRYRDFVFATEEIEYSHEELRARASSTVSLQSGQDLIVTGKGLKVSVEQEEMIIEEDVKATLFNVQWVNARGRMPM
jgi:LPS export ABC transporter protein LptC